MSIVARTALRFAQLKSAAFIPSASSGADADDGDDIDNQDRVRILDRRTARDRRGAGIEHFTTVSRQPQRRQTE